MELRKSLFLFQLFWTMYVIFFYNTVFTNFFRLRKIPQFSKFSQKIDCTFTCSHANPRLTTGEFFSCLVFPKVWFLNSFDCIIHISCTFFLRSRTLWSCFWIIVQKLKHSSKVLLQFEITTFQTKNPVRNIWFCVF